MLHFFRNIAFVAVCLATNIFANQPRFEPVDTRYNSVDINDQVDNEIALLMDWGLVDFLYEDDDDEDDEGDSYTGTNQTNASDSDEDETIYRSEDDESYGRSTEDEGSIGPLRLSQITVVSEPEVYELPVRANSAPSTPRGSGFLAELPDSGFGRSYCDQTISFSPFSSPAKRANPRAVMMSMSPDQLGEPGPVRARNDVDHLEHLCNAETSNDGQGQ